MKHLFSLLILSIFLAVLTSVAVAAEGGAESAEKVPTSSADSKDKKSPGKAEEEPDCE